jgi:hypothetical protein
MITLRVLSTAAVMALLLPMAAPTASFAEGPKPSGGAGVRMGGGGGGAPVAHFNGGGGAQVMHSNPVGGSRPPVAQFNAGAGGPSVTHFNAGAGGAPVAHFDGDRDRHRRGGGFIPGLAAGAIIGGVASQSYGYYDGPGYYAPGYYDDQYYDQGVVAVAPGPVGDDAIAYCMQTYRSYDPASGTYLGFDGYRHPCP